MNGTNSNGSSSGPALRTRWTRGKVACLILFVFFAIAGVLSINTVFHSDHWNHVLYSNQLEQSPWRSINASVEADAAVSPDGENTAERITSAIADGYVVQDFQGLEPGTYDYSIYLRADRDSQIGLFIVSYPGGDVSIDRMNVSLSPNWTRANMRIRLDNAGPLSIQIGGDNTFDAGSPVYAWGAQLTRLRNPDDATPPLLATAAEPVNLSSLPILKIIGVRKGASLTALLLTAMAMYAGYLFVFDRQRHLAGLRFERRFPAISRLNILAGTNSNGSSSGPALRTRWTRGKVACLILFVFFAIAGVLSINTVFHSDHWNHVLYSNQLEQSPWRSINASVEADAAVSPDGENTAERITSAIADGYVVQDFQGLEPGTYDYSIYLRADRDSQIGLFIVSYPGGAVSIDRKNVGISPQWSRVNMRTRLVEAGSLSIQIGGDKTFNSGSPVYAWGVQLSRLRNAKDATPRLLATAAAPVNLSSLPIPTIISVRKDTFLTALLSMTMAMGVGHLLFADRRRRLVGLWLQRRFPALTHSIRVYPSSMASNFSRQTFLLVFFVYFALAAQITVTTPMTMLVAQPETYQVAFAALAGLGVALSVVFACLLTALSALAPHPLMIALARLFLAISLATAAEQLLLTDIRPFGELTGQPVQWDQYKAIARLDLLVLLGLFTAGLFFLRKAGERRLAALSGAILMFSIAPTLVFAVSNWKQVANQQQRITSANDYSSFFKFSRSKNIFYYQPDSVSSDIVQWVFNEHPEIAEEFDGFVFFEDNLGAYNGTLIGTYSVFTGENANIYDDGYGHHEFQEAAAHKGFPLLLNKFGYRTEFVPVYQDHCIGDYSICILRHIEDLTPKSLSDLKSSDFRKDWLLLLDVSIFRHAPHLAKKHIYNTGNWLLRDRFRSLYETGDNGVGPVLKEVADQIKIVDGPPRFKWYGGLGAHQPEGYDENCQRLPKPVYSVETGRMQVLCVLREYVAFLRALKAAGVYDNTALILNADTGSGNRAWDLINYPDDVAVTESQRGAEPNLEQISMARPALLIKPVGAHGGLSISHAQTHQVDIPATVLDLAGIPSSYSAPSVFDIGEGEVVKRKFFRIFFPIRYGNADMNFDEYDVIGPANDWRSYRRVNWHRKANSDVPPPPNSEQAE